jgi:protein gp37
MADKTGIEWTDATWNPVRGCTRVSEGCRNCYAEVLAARFSDPGQSYHGLATRNPARWTGDVKVIEDAMLLPLRWKRGRRIFVNSTSDLFHEKVAFGDIDRIFAVMALAPQHTFQILTKRPDRMIAYMEPQSGRRSSGLGSWVLKLGYQGPLELLKWPLPNVWLGVSVENQAAADERIPLLLQTPAAKRFLSCEPLLGPIRLDRLTRPTEAAIFSDDCLSGERGTFGTQPLFGPRVDWVIAGGESGPGARPMHPDWARGLRDQCAAAGVPFFFKQHGEYAPVG